MKEEFKKLNITIWLGLAHGLNDLIAGFLIAFYSATLTNVNIWTIYFTYVLIGFGGQVFAGLLVDFYKSKTRHFLVAILFIFIFCVFYIHIPPILLTILIGIASSFIHVIGGALSLQNAKNVQNRHVGIFAAPGTIGLALGGLLSLQPALATAIFAVLTLFLTLTFLFIDKSAFILQETHEKVDNQRLIKFEKHGIIMALLLLMFTFRSVLWEVGQYLFVQDIQAITIIAGFAFFGKLLGGLASEKFTPKTYIYGTLGIALFLFSISFKNLWLIAMGNAFLQSSIPITLQLLYQQMPEKPATASGLGFGLTLLIAGIPFLRWSGTPYTPYLYLIGGIALVLINILLFRSKAMEKQSI